MIHYVLLKLAPGADLDAAEADLVRAEKWMEGK